MLGPVLPERPQFICRKAPPLHDRLAPGVINPPVQSENRLFLFLSGFYACGHCTACRHSNVKKQKEYVAAVTDRKYPIKQLITCSTVGIVYMLECDCGWQYIGRTSRPLHVRLGEHVNIKKDFKTHNVFRHFKMHHNQNPRGLTFWGIERVTKHWRGVLLVILAKENRTGYTRQKF